MQIARWLAVPTLVAALCVTGLQKKARLETGTTTTEPDKVFPCWNQSWKCGDWRPLTHMPRRGEVTNESMATGVCGWCSSIRLINSKDRTERIIRSFRSRLNPCKHRWTSGLHHKSVEPIESGDALFIIYDDHMYALMVQKVFTHLGHGKNISYKIARITDRGDFPTRINLEELSWKSQTAEGQIPIGDRKIPFDNWRVTPADGSDARDFVTIAYDNFYGGWRGPSATTHETSAHIAIVHQSDLESNRFVDLTKFRFKTWEDGLGNRCDTIPDEPPEVRDDVVFLDLHSGVVRSVVAAPDGSYVASVGDDGCVVIQHLGQSIRKIIGPFQEEPFLCLAVSGDGATLLAGGLYDLFRSILKINVRDARYEEIRIVAKGSMSAMYYYNNDKCITYVTAGNKLSFFELEARRLLASYNIFGGFPWDIAASADGSFFAIISQNVVANRTAEPSKLTIFDQRGNETLSHQFENYADAHVAHHSKVIFLAPDRVALLLPTGKIHQWVWSPESRKWRTAERVEIPQGPFSAVASSSDGKVLWLAKEQSILAVNVKTGGKLYERCFDIAKPTSPVFAEPITAIALIPGKQSLALAFCDGRVALMPIPQTCLSSGVK